MPTEDYRGASYEIWQAMASGWERDRNWLREASRAVSEKMLQALEPQPRPHDPRAGGRNRRDWLCGRPRDSSLGPPDLHRLRGRKGLRVSDACATNVEDLGRERGHRTLRIVGKGNRSAIIPLVPRTARTIDLAVGERCEGPIVRRRDGKRLDRRTAHRWVRSIGTRAGFGAVQPHTLRAAFIMAALDAGVPLRDVQIAARHTDPRRPSGNGHYPPLGPAAGSVTGEAAVWHHEPAPLQTEPIAEMSGTALGHCCRRAIVVLPNRWARPFLQYRLSVRSAGSQPLPHVVPGSGAAAGDEACRDQDWVRRALSSDETVKPLEVDGGS